MRWHLPLLAALVVLASCSSTNDPGNGLTPTTDGGSTPDTDASTGDARSGDDGGSDSGENDSGAITNPVGPLCIPEDTRAAALASDPFCEDCFCVECLESQSATAGGSTLKSNRPEQTCSTDTSASMLAFRLQGDRLRVIEANPLRKLLMVRERAASIFAGVSQKAAGPGLTDAEVVAALAGLRNAEQEMMTLRSDFSFKVDRFKMDAWSAADGVFTRWYNGTPLAPTPYIPIPGQTVTPDNRVEFAKMLERKISASVDFEAEIDRASTPEAAPLTVALLGKTPAKNRASEYRQVRTRLADAARNDAAAKALTLKGDPAFTPWGDDIRLVLLDKPSFEDIQYAISYYRDTATQEIDFALGEVRRRISTLPRLTRTDGLPDLGEAKPASIYLTLGELLRRYYDSDEWKRAVTLFGATADKLYEETPRETVMDDDITSLITSDDDAEALIAALKRHFEETLATPAMIDCRDLDAASKEPVPCYVDSAVLQLVASHDQEGFDRLAPRYLTEFNELFMKKGERLVSRKTYDAELASYKQSVIAQYTRAITKVSDLDLCAVRNAAFKETVAAREKNAIGAFFYDTCDLAFQDWYGKKIDDSVKNEIDMRIAGLSQDIRARTTFRGVRENWVGDEKMSEVLTAAFNGASGAAQSFVRSYTKGIKRTSAIVKSVSNIVVVVGATILVPATGGASAVAMSVLTVGTAAGTVEVVLTKLDDASASAVTAFARGFASGAVPTLLQGTSSALVFQLARTRLLSGTTMGGLSLLENVSVGALSAGSIHVIDSAIEGKPIDPTELLTHTLTGGVFGGSLFSAHTALRIGWAARVRTKSQKLLDPMAFEGVAAKLQYMGLASRKDAAGNVDWGAVYDDLTPLLGTQQGRATALSRLANDAQGKALLGRLMDGYGPTFVAPTAPVGVNPATPSYTRVMRRLEGILHETGALRQEIVALKQANSALEGVCDYTGRVYYQDTAFWTDMVQAAGAGVWVSRPVLSKFLTAQTPEAAEIRRLFSRAKEVFRDADINAFYGNIFPRTVNGKLKRGAIGDMLDDGVLCDLGITLNPKVAGFNQVTEPIVIKFDGDIGGVISDLDVTKMMRTFRTQLENMGAQSPAGGVYKTPGDGRKGFIVAPMIGGVQTKSGVLIDVNDPRLFPLAKRYFRMVKEEVMHTVQYRAKDGLVVFSDDLRSWYRRRFDVGTEEAKLANNLRFNEELKFFHEIDIVTYQTQSTMDPTMSTDEVIRSYPQRLSFLKKILNDPYERGRDFPRDWSHILQKQNMTAGEVRTRGQ